MDLFRVIAKCSFVEMRRMVSGPEMATVLVKAWPKIQWEIEKEDRLRLKYMAGRYLDGTLAMDCKPSSWLVQATQQYRADMRWMEYFHATTTADIEVSHANGERWVYNLIVKTIPRVVKGKDGNFRPVLRTVADMALFMGWATAAPFGEGTPSIFNKGMCAWSGRKRK